MSESLCCLPETITLLTNYTPIQKKQFNKKHEQLSFYSYTKPSLSHIKWEKSKMKNCIDNLQPNV